MPVAPPETYAPKAGDRVCIKASFAPAGLVGRVFVVERVKKVNVVARPEAGGRGIDYPAYALEPAGDAPVTTVPFVPVTVYSLGEVVTLKRPMAGTPADLPYVVVKDTGTGRVNVARVGGDGDRYIRADRGGLVKRDVAWLAERLVDLS